MVTYFIKPRSLDCIRSSKQSSNILKHAYGLSSRATMKRCNLVFSLKTYGNCVCFSSKLPRFQNFLLFKTNSCMCMAKATICVTRTHAGLYCKLTIRLIVQYGKTHFRQLLNHTRTGMAAAIFSLMNIKQEQSIEANKKCTNTTIAHLPM